MLYFFIPRQIALHAYCPIPFILWCLVIHTKSVTFTPFVTIQWTDAISSFISGLYAPNFALLSKAPSTLADFKYGRLLHHIHAHQHCPLPSKTRQDWKENKLIGLYPRHVCPMSFKDVSPSVQYFSATSGSSTYRCLIAYFGLRSVY